MSWVVVGRIESGSVIWLSIDIVEPAATNITSDYTIQPFVLRMPQIMIIGICYKIMVIYILRDEFLAHKYYDEHYCQLIDGLAYYVFEHYFVYDVVIAAMWFTF